MNHPINLLKNAINQHQARIDNLQSQLNKVCSNQMFIEEEIKSHKLYISQLQNSLNILLLFEKKLTIYVIINVVFNYFKINPSEVNNVKRKRELVKARQVSMYFAEKLLLLSHEEIGKIICKRERSTVYHSIKAVHNEIETNVTFNKEIDELEKLFKKCEL